jgi:hypothetical protein
MCTYCTVTVYSFVEPSKSKDTPEATTTWVFAGFVSKISGTDWLKIENNGLVSLSSSVTENVYTGVPGAESSAILTVGPSGKTNAGSESIYVIYDHNV